MPDLEAPARPLAPEPVPFVDRLQQWRRDPRVGAAVVVVVVLAAFVVWIRSGTSHEASPARAGVSVPAIPAPTTTTAPRALVHVVGAVRTPGVVELDSGARVRDALAAAGGPADDADVDRLNLAAPVNDGERVDVPRRGEPDPVPVAGDATANGSVPSGPLDLNTATATDLETLPGIGPTLAEAIVRQREKMGRFQSVDDLKQVRGIGEGRFGDIKELVRVRTRRDLGPLIALAAVIAGLLLGERAGGAPARVALAAGVIGLVGAWLVDGPTRVVVAALALGLLGTAVMQRALDGLARNPLAAAVASGEPVNLSGVLVSDPAGQRFGADALLRVDGFARVVLVRATGTDASRLRVLEAGDHVDVAGHLTAVPRTGFDARARWDHAVAILTDTDVRAFRPARGGLASVANHARAVVLEGTKPLDPNARALLAGFLLGDTRALPDQIRDEYRASGLSHLLAVSGANVAFVLLVFAPLLRRLSLLPRTGLALAVIICFAAATRFEPSVLRASALTSVTILTSFVGRPVSRVRGLVLAIVALLLLDPFLVHSIGFHLSCAASGGIAVFARPLARHLRGPALLREPLAVSIAAQLGVTPVLLLTFGSVPVISPVANLLAYPAAEAIGVFGLAASVVGGIVPPIGIVLAPITTALLAWVTAVAHQTAGVGGDIDKRGALAIAALTTITVVVRRVRRRKSQFTLGFRGNQV